MYESNECSYRRASTHLFIETLWPIKLSQRVPTSDLFVALGPVDLIFINKNEFCMPHKRTQHLDLSLNSDSQYI